MQKILGLFRLLLALIVLIVGVLLVLLACLWPWRVQQCRLAAWVTVWIVRSFNRIFAIQVICPDAAKLRRHQGLIFPNHLSYLDIITLLSLRPMRFLSMAAVRNYPLIGWIAQAIGTVFVVREDENSRHQAREAIVASFAQEPDPPIVLFPEGKLGLGNQLLPFRHGAFELAVEHGIAFLPCVLRYTPLEVATWQHGGLWVSVWRLAQFSGSLQIEVIPLTVVQPGAEDDPVQLATMTQQAMEQAFE